LNCFKEIGRRPRDHSSVTGDTASCIDLRGLDPPEPLVRVLETLEARGPGPHVFLLSRSPLMLYPILARDGWGHAVRRDERGFELTVFRANP
jgi:hypothetical protein